LKSCATARQAPPHVDAFVDVVRAHFADGGQ